MSTTTTPNPDPNDQQETVEQPKPPQKEYVEAPQSQSLLDKIVSESQIAGRDALIVKRAEFDQKQRLARMFANSGCFQDIDKDENKQWLSQETSIARAMVKIELGESMGFTAAESMTGIDIIKGRVAVGASLRAARMQRAGFSWPQMIVTDKGCWVPLCFQGEPMMCPRVTAEGEMVTGTDGKLQMVQVVVSFTEADARMLGLFEKTSSMYKKDPSSMYFARAITRAQRRYGPGVLRVDILDTYEARDIEPDTPAKEIARTVPPDGDPRWFQAGSVKAAEDVVAQKLAAAGLAPRQAKQEPHNEADKQEQEPLSPVVIASILGHQEKQAQALEALEIEKQILQAQQVQQAKVEPPQDPAAGPMMRFNSWGDIGPSSDEQMDPRLGLKVEVKGMIYTREDVSETWTRQPGQQPPTTARPNVPVFGRPKK